MATCLRSCRIMPRTSSSASRGWAAPRCAQLCDDGCWGGGGYGPCRHRARAGLACLLRPARESACSCNMVQATGTPCASCGTFLPLLLVSWPTARRSSGGGLGAPCLGWGWAGRPGLAGLQLGWALSCDWRVPPFPAPPAQVGVVANQPSVLAGCLDIDASVKVGSWASLFGSGVLTFKLAVFKLQRASAVHLSIDAGAGRPPRRQRAKSGSKRRKPRPMERCRAGKLACAGLTRPPPVTQPSFPQHTGSLIYGPTHTLVHTRRPCPLPPLPPPRPLEPHIPLPRPRALCASATPSTSRSSPLSMSPAFCPARPRSTAASYGGRAGRRAGGQAALLHTKPLLGRRRCLPAWSARPA